MFSAWNWSRFLEQSDSFLEIIYGDQQPPACPDDAGDLAQSISRGLHAAVSLSCENFEEADSILADDDSMQISQLEQLAAVWLLGEILDPQEAYEALLAWPQKQKSNFAFSSLRPRSILEQRDRKASLAWLPVLRYYMASQLDEWNAVIKQQAALDFDEARKNGVQEPVLSHLRFAFRFNEARQEKPLKHLLTLAKDWYDISQNHDCFQMKPTYLLEVSLLLEHENRLKEALAWIERGLASHPGLYEFILSKARIQKKLGLFESCLVTCDQLVEAFSDDYAGYCLRSNLYFLIGLNDQARRDADKAVLLAPDSPDSYMARAFVNLQLSQYQLALDDFGQVLKRDPKRYDALRGQGKCLSMLGRDYDALACFNQMRRQHPDDPDIYYEMADVLFAAGYLDDCEAICNQCLKLDPEYVGVMVILGMIALRKDDEEKARQLLTEAVDLEPDNPFALNELSYLLYIEGEDEAAIELVERAIKESPDYADALCNKGIIHYFRSEFETATEVFDQAVRLMPEHVSAWVGKGNALTQLSDFDEALRCYDNALMLDPHNADACHGKALLYRMLGLEDEGRKWQEKAVRFDPSIDDF